MTVRSQRNLRDKLGVDSRANPAFLLASLERSRVPIVRQLFEARQRTGNRAWNTAQFEHVFTRNSIAGQPVGQRRSVRRVAAHTERYYLDEGMQRTMLLMEPARTNLFLNSEAPITQTITLPATGNYTISVEGPGTVTVAAGTATITGGGAATPSAPRTINCTATGTITVTVTATPYRVQVEAGAYATSHIPTAGTSVQRVAETCVWTPTAAGSRLLLPGAGGAGTLVVQARLLAHNIGSNQTIFQIDDGTDNNRITVEQIGSNLFYARYVSAGTTTVNHSGTQTQAVGSFIRFAVAWQGTTFVFTYTGNTVLSATGTAPVALNAIRLGARVTGGFEFGGGGIGIVHRANTRLPNNVLTDMVRV